MKTAIINLDDLTPEVFKELIGFVLTIGLNFRKLDQKKESGTGRCLFVELETKAEEKALKEFLTVRDIVTPILIGNENKACLDGKKLGKFIQVEDGTYIDKSTGRKFSIV